MASQIILSFDSRVCKVCEKKLPVASFGISRRSSDGLLSRCKPCERTRVAKYLKDPETKAKYAATKREWIARNAQRVQSIKRRSFLKNKDKVRAKSKEWKRRYPEKVNAATRRRYKARGDEARSKAAQYREQNRERRRILNRNQYRKNIAKSRAIGKRNAALRRARKLLSSYGFTEAGWIAKCEYWGWACYLCRTPLSFATATLDHRIPLVHGGLDCLSNIAPACHSCNCSKRHTPEMIYRARRGFALRFSLDISPALPF